MVDVFNGNYISQQLVERIRQTLRDRFGSESLSIQRAKSVFANIDVNNDGLISQREFRNAMNTLKVDLEVDDVTKIFEKYDREGTGKLRYKYFVDLLGGVHSRYDDHDEHTKALVRTIRKRIEDALGYGHVSARKLREAFVETDINNSGDIDGREFKRAMKNLRVQLSNDEVRDIYDKFDKNGNGRLNYQEFMDLLGFDSPNPRQTVKRSMSRDSMALVETIRKRIEDAMGGRISSRNLREAFEECDDDKSGDIDGREFKRAMRHLRVELSNDEVRDIYAKFDKNGNGRLNYREFSELLGY